MLLVKPEDITVDVLDQVTQEWDDMRLLSYTRTEVIRMASELKKARWDTWNLETRAMLKARKLRMLGFTKQEIRELFDIKQAELTKWLKGMD